MNFAKSVFFVAFVLNTGLSFASADKGKMLFDAVAHGDEYTVAKLLKQGVDPNVYRNDSGYTALIQSAVNNTVGNLKALLEHQADVHAKTNDGITSLMAAAHHYLILGKNDALKMLLEKNADINAQDEKGNTALMRVFLWSKDDKRHLQSKLAVMKFLVENGADLMLTNSDKKSIINIAQDMKIFETSPYSGESVFAKQFRSNIQLYISLKNAQRAPTP